MSKLNNKQQAFVEEYLIDLNATQAAIRAGYSKKTARAIGQENLTKPDIAKAIETAKQERSERTRIDADTVLLRLGEMIDADPCDIICAKTGAYKSIHEWPLVWRRMLSAADVQEIYDGRGDEREKVGEIVKYKFIDKLKAFELVGKHVDVQAFKERIDSTNTNLNINAEIDEETTPQKAASIYQDMIKSV